MASTCRVLSVSNKREGCGLFLECQITELFFLPSLFFSAHPALQFRGKTFFFLPFPLVLLYAQAYVCVCVCVHTSSVCTSPTAPTDWELSARASGSQHSLYYLYIHTYSVCFSLMVFLHTYGSPFFFLVWEGYKNKGAR